MNVAILINGDRGVYIVKKLSYVKYINLKGIIYSDLKKKRYFENNLKKFKKKLFFQKKINSKKNEKKLKSLNLDIILIAGFSQILKKHIINKAKNCNKFAWRTGKKVQRRFTFELASYSWREKDRN